MSIVDSIRSQFPAIGELYLYGSRSKPHYLLANFDQDSDWDYAAQFSDTILTVFRASDWEEVDASMYQDSSTEQVFAKEVDGVKVQVSLRKSLPVFKIAWKSISSDFYWMYINKRSATALPKEHITLYLNQLYWITLGHFGTPKDVNAAQAWNEEDFL